MAYTKQTWANEDPTTPIDADRLGHIEDGIAAAATIADTASAAVTAEATRATVAEALKVAKAGDTMSGDLAMGGHRVTGQADPVAAQDGATKAWTSAQITALVNGAPGILDTLGEIATALQSDESTAAALAASVALKAPLASPALTGTPTVNGAPLSAGGVTATVDGTPASSLALTTGVVPLDIGAAYASIAWQALTNYKANQLVYQSGSFYYANADFTSGASFNPANWTQIVTTTPIYGWTPPDYGYGTWTGDPLFFQTGGAPSAAGVVQLGQMKAPLGITVTKLVVDVFAAGSTLTNCYAALFDGSGAQLGVTADQSAVWNSTGLKAMSLAGGAVPVAAGTRLFVALLVGSAGTLPQFYRSSAGSSLQFNQANTGANSRFATSGSALTAMPGSITLSGASVGGFSFWAATS